jgi:hypothetical protein
MWPLQYLRQNSGSEGIEKTDAKQEEIITSKQTTTGQKFGGCLFITIPLQIPTA